MPCDDSTTCPIEIPDLSSKTIANGQKSSVENERNICRKKRRHLQSKISTKNHYKMAPKPINVNTTNLSASCPSSTSSSSSSSSSSNSSCWDRPRQNNDSTNSSSSLILILERPEILNNHDKLITKTDKILSLNDENQDNTNDSSQDDELNARVSQSGGFSGKVTISSIENLAKKKAATTRCRRKRSTASPRNKRNTTLIIDEKLRKFSNPTYETTTACSNETTTGDFVATSTLTKNNDCSAITKNSTRSAGKLRCDDTRILRNYDESLEVESTNVSSRQIQNIASKGTFESAQQTIISVAAIRGTNVNVETRNNNNNNENENSTRLGRNLTAKARSNVSYASAPSLNNNNSGNGNNMMREACRNHEFSSHSTSSRSSTILPLLVVSARSPVSSLNLQRDTSMMSKNDTKKTTKQQALTTSVCKQLPSNGSTVKSTSYVLSSKRDLTSGFTKVFGGNTLKSSASFTVPKVMKKGPNSSHFITSFHASLGQLPITRGSCSKSDTYTNNGEATSLENTEIWKKSQLPNDEMTFVPINLYSTSSASPGKTKIIFNHGRNSSMDKISQVCGTTTSSSFTNNKTPLRIVAMPEVGNSTNNVANAFRNNLAASGCNNNSNNNNNNVARCNHLIGTCACSGTTTNSQTSSTLTRTSNLVNGIATSSSWTNNSVEQETDYVVDPVQGNAYHKGQFLGKGGFARVYLMTDVANGNQYACKIIPKNRMQKIHIQKIAREIMIHKELNHVNVVQMHHYFEDNINVYMLLEPCPRKSLMHVLKYRGKITEPEARYYMRQMVTGVAYIHSQKVVHRDLKPGNMFLSDGMIVKIGDFGLATRPDGQRRRVTICGTPNYIAPEVLYKQAYSYEADVWALGCILYALLAGQPPFDTSTLKETYARICNNRYKKLDDSVISRSGQDLIHWLLQPIPELRPSLERVKEHAYLTMEYVPTKLSHTCCYRIPITQTIVMEKSATMSNQRNATMGNAMLTRIGSSENINVNKREGSTRILTMRNLHETGNVTTTTTSQINLDNGKINDTVKKPKVGNWLLRKLPKLPRFRQRLSKLLCPENKKPADCTLMHRAIECCLAEIRCPRALENPIMVDGIAPLFVTKWIDYSNKYGLGFQLSDRSVGVLFNDSTKMSYTHDRRRVEYATTDDEVTRYRRENDVPTSMEEKLELLRHFTHYMDNFLTNGGEVREQRTTKFSRTNSSNVPRMRRWLRTDKAIVMELSVPLLQVNFFVDHSKIVVSEGTRGRGYLVTYIDAGRQATSYWLNDLRDNGCTAELYERLNYVSKVIAELENDAIFDNTTQTTQTTTNVVQHRNKTLRT